MSYKDPAYYCVRCNVEVDRPPPRCRVCIMLDIYNKLIEQELESNDAHTDERGE